MRLKQKYRDFAADVPAALRSAAPDPATAALQGQIGALQASQAPAVPADPLENIPLPALAKQWLRANPEYLYEADKNQRLQALHWELVAAGMTEYSEPYFEEASRRLRAESNSPVASLPHRAPPEPQRENRHVSAPPSRDVPTGDGVRGGFESDVEFTRIRLSQAEKESARIAGVSLADYAAGKLDMMRRKQRGELQ